MSSAPSSEPLTRRPLCPRCGCAKIRITTAVRVAYDLVFDVYSDDFAVVDETMGDATWDGSSPSECTSCGWNGCVADLGSPSPA